MLRGLVYRGSLLVLPRTAASTRWVSVVTALVAAEVGPLRDAGARPAGALFQAVTRARRRLVDLPEWPHHARAILTSCGFDADAYAVDVPRLRCVPGGGHRIPEAAPAFFVHRDTWYANPAAQINVWIPLHDVAPDRTFVWYPAAWGVAVDNDSSCFDLDDWAERVGFQNPNPPAACYPRALGQPPGPACGVGARAGDVVVFAAASLHGTRAHDGVMPRFSVDFRVVHRGDVAAGRGAPDPDNGSRGSTLGSYRSGA